MRQWISSIFHKPAEADNMPPMGDSGDKEREARERLAQIQEREARLRSLYLESQLFHPKAERDE